jgi:pilus assembly protein Flp/PilA
LLSGVFKERRMKREFFKDKDVCEEVKKMKRILNKVVYFITSRERGATAVEYALMVALIAVAIILAVTALGGGISAAFENITGSLGAIAP